MFRFIFIFLLGVVGLLADFSMQHTIIFSVAPTNQLGQVIGASPVFSMRGAGSCNCHNTYSVFTNETNKKISASLDQDMPSGSTLTVYLAPPTGARTTGAQILSATPVDLVLGISQVSESELAMIYTMTTTAKVGVRASETRVVTYTMTDG